MNEPEPFAPRSQSEIEARLGYRFKRPELLAQALTHASFAHEAPDLSPHYDRLEFLGDAVLGLILAEHEMARAPDATSGVLSVRRAHLARRPTLAAEGQLLGLGEYAKLSYGERHQGGVSRRRLLGDLYEAVLGAIYLDGGIEEARAFVRATLIAHQGQEEAPPLEDFKSTLQERLQAEGKAPPRYRVAEVTGPPHAPTFRVEVEIEGRCAGKGTGTSRREAEQAAAREALLPARE